MDSRRIVEKLRLLAPDEAALLYWKCKGLKTKDIYSDKLNVSESQYHIIRGKVYAKLGITSTAKSELTETLELDICPMLRRMVALIKEDFDKWPPTLEQIEAATSPQPEPDKPAGGKPQTSASAGETKEAQDAQMQGPGIGEGESKDRQNDGGGKEPPPPPPPPPIVVPPPPEPPPIIVPSPPHPRVPRSWAIVALVLVAVVSVFILRRQPESREPEPAAMMTSAPATAQVEVARQPTAIPSSVATVVVTEVRIVTATPPPLTSTPKPTPVPSSTPVPTSTSVPTATPMPVLFEDDFEQGPKPDWQPIQGTWRMVNGTYAPDVNGTLNTTFVGDEGWTNYKVDVDVIGDGLDYPPRIIVRAKGNSYIVLAMTYIDTTWLLVRDGRETQLAHVDRGGLRGSWGTRERDHLTVEVKGDIYTAYCDGVVFLTVQDDTLKSGRVGLSTQGAFQFDNFKVTALP